MPGLCRTFLNPALAVTCERPALAVVICVVALLVNQGASAFITEKMLLKNRELLSSSLFAGGTEAENRSREWSAGSAALGTSAKGPNGTMSFMIHACVSEILKSLEQPFLYTPNTCSMTPRAWDRPHMNCQNLLYRFWGGNSQPSPIRLSLVSLW